MTLPPGEELDILQPGRVPPRECVRAARDALTKAYGITDSRQTWPFMLEALDWLRRGLEQVAAQLPPRDDDDRKPEEHA